MVSIQHSTEYSLIVTVPGWLPLTGLSWLPFALACGSPTDLADTFSTLISIDDEFKVNNASCQVSFHKRFTAVNAKLWDFSPTLLGNVLFYLL